MQAPGNFEGLDRALAALGYADALRGLKPDVLSRDKLRERIQWTFEQSEQTRQDRLRRDDALAMIGAFPWALLQTRDALRAATLTLRSRKPSKIMRMRIVDEDEEGVAQSIEVNPAVALDHAVGLRATRVRLSAKLLRAAARELQPNRA